MTNERGHLMNQVPVTIVNFGQREMQDFSTVVTNENITIVGTPHCT
jgi:hypothetical protein